MTDSGLYDWQDVHMDLIELARSIQADRERDIASTLQRRRWLTPTQAPAPDGRPADRATGAPSRVGQSVPSTRATR